MYYENDGIGAGIHSSSVASDLWASLSMEVFDFWFFNDYIVRV